MSYFADAYIYGNTVSGYDGACILVDSNGVMDPMTENSYKQAKDNVEFYREQLEMLREDVEAQNARISQHYEEKVSPSTTSHVTSYQQTGALLKIFPSLMISLSNIRLHPCYWHKSNSFTENQATFCSSNLLRESVVLADVRTSS